MYCSYSAVELFLSYCAQNIFFLLCLPEKLFFPHCVSKMQMFKLSGRSLQFMLNARHVSIGLFSLDWQHFFFWAVWKSEKEAKLVETLKKKTFFKCFRTQMLESKTFWVSTKILNIYWWFCCHNSFRMHSNNIKMTSFYNWLDCSVYVW